MRSTYITHTHTSQRAGSDTIALVPSRGAIDDDPAHSAYTIVPEWLVEHIIFILHACTCTHVSSLKEVKHRTLIHVSVFDHAKIQETPLYQLYINYYNCIFCAIPCVFYRTHLLDEIQYEVTTIKRRSE